MTDNTATYINIIDTLVEAKAQACEMYKNISDTLCGYDDAANALHEAIEYIDDALNETGKAMAAYVIAKANTDKRIIF